MAKGHQLPIAGIVALGALTRKVIERFMLIVTTDAICQASVIEEHLLPVISACVAIGTLPWVMEGRGVGFMA